MMTWPQWVAAVLAIMEARGMDVTVTYPTATWVTFTWQCRNRTRFGSGGAGAEFIHLTTPEAYTALWYCELDTPTVSDRPAPDPTQPDWIARKGRHVPRVPAMAVSDALQELFKL